MSEHTQPHTLPYGFYWKIWGVLLALTVVMIAIDNRLVLLAGIVVKATLIAMWFMHLKYEFKWFTWTLVLATALTAGCLFGLIAPDGFAMLSGSMM